MNIPEILPCPNPECRYDKMCVCSMNNVVGDATCGCTYWAACLKCGYQGPKALSEGEAIEKHNAICRQPTPEAVEYKSVTELAAEHPNLVEYLESWDPVKFIPNVVVCQAACQAISDTYILEAFLKTLNQLRDAHAATLPAHPPKPPAEWMEALESLADEWISDSEDEASCPTHQSRGPIECAEDLRTFIKQHAPKAPEGGK